MTYVKNAWYVAGWDQDLETGKPFAITILGQPIVIYRSSSGNLAALEDRCVHRHAPLSLGRCEGENLRCMYHGLLFAADGKVMQIPGQEIIPPQARVRAYRVVSRHSWIWVWMGDPARADEALIPPAVGLDDPDWILGCGLLDYDAEARLISDNLTDFSHLSYVHAESFQAGPEFAENLPRITPLDRGVRFERWVPQSAHAPSNPTGQDLDRWQTYDYLIPGVLLMWSAGYPKGTAQKAGQAGPDRKDAVTGLNFTSQAVTPTGDKSARYFFSWGPHKDHGDEAMRDTMMQLAGMAFGEDKVMIEAQQKVVNTNPEHPIMPISHDRGVTLFNRLVKRLAKEEIAAA